MHGGGQLQLRGQKVAARLSTPLRMQKRFRTSEVIEKFEDTPRLVSREGLPFSPW
jgi:hypothetical protein